MTAPMYVPPPTQPAETLKYGDTAYPGYSYVYAKWQADGQAGTVESLMDGWQYRVLRPNPSDPYPQFGLIVFGTPTDAEDGGFPDGITAYMSTHQSSLPGRLRQLPPTPPGGKS
jgi:hypothetical protein